jgi:ketosteroid isomerase-like protein
MKTFLCFGLAVASLGFAADPKADEQAVRTAVKAFDDAARKLDRATLDKLLSPDLIYVHSLGQLENKQQCIEALLKAKIDFQMQPNPTVKLHGDTAVVHARTTSNLMQEGKPAKVPLDMMQVWVRKGSAWQMVARHTNRPAPPQ